MKTLGEILLLFVLVGVNAFFVAAEMALVRVRRTRIDQLVEQGNRTAKLIQDELEVPSRYISACQLGITFATLALGAVGEAAFAEDLTGLLIRMPVFEGQVYALHVAKVAVYFLAFSVTAFVQTVFGELMPKQITLVRAEQVMFALVWPMRGWCWLTWPFLNILEGFSSIVMKALKLPEPTRHHSVHTNEELKMLVSASQEEGVLELEEEEMIHSVFDFSDTVVKEVMTPRTDMICMNADSTVKDFVDMALQNGYSRLPVYEEDVDDIFGAVHIRDALRAIMENRDNEPVRPLVKNVLVVPENKPAGDLLTDFKKNKTHMAVVVDEYGGTLGLITMDDLLEELVGDIPDEHDADDEEIFQDADGSVLFDAKMSLYDAAEKLHIELDDEEFNTVGGHVFGELGRKPQIGDEIETDTFIMRVESADRHRILKLRLIRKHLDESESEANGNGTAHGGGKDSKDSKDGKEHGSNKTVESSN